MSWTDSTVGTFDDFMKASESLTLPDSEGAVETSVGSSTIGHDLSNKKFLVTLEVTEACAGNGSLDVKLQASYDESTWEDLDASLGLAVDSTGLNSDTAWCDTTLYQAAYYRFVVFSDGTDTQDDATVTLTYSAKVR
jgi:hypothetical protein